MTLSVTHRRPCHAFTLIELVIVLVIVGTMAAIVAPRFVTAQTRYESQLTARWIAAEITRARDHARANRMSTYVHVVPNWNVIVAVDASSRDINKYVLDAEREAQITEVDFSGRHLIEFNGFGEAASDCTVTIRSGRWYSTVTVDASSGVISVSETPSYR